MSESTDRFIELHTEFQDAHSKYMRQGTGLYLAQRVNSLGDDASVASAASIASVVGVVSVAEVLSGGFKVIGTFPIPIIDPSDVELFDKTLFRKSNDRAVGQGTVRRRKQRECVAFMPSRQRGDVSLIEPGAAEFCRLAEKAGRMLPKSIRDVLPWKFEPSGFAGRWLAAMFWHKPPEARQFRSYNREGLMSFQYWPFSESADVIEDFGLLTETPHFRPSEGMLPAWARFHVTDRSPVKGNGTESSDAVQVLQELLNGVIPKRARTQRRAVELLIDYEGRLPIADLAKDDKIDWTLEEWDNNVSTLLPRLKKHLRLPWSFDRDDNAIVVTFNGKPVKK